MMLFLGWSQGISMAIIGGVRSGASRAFLYRENEVIHKSFIAYPVN